MPFFDTLLSYSFMASLALVYIAVPLAVSYYLYRHKFMSDRLRYSFAFMLAFNVLFIIFLVILDIIA